MTEEYTPQQVRAHVEKKAREDELTKEPWSLEKEEKHNDAD